MCLLGFVIYCLCRYALFETYVINKQVVNLPRINKLVYKSFIIFCPSYKFYIVRGFINPIWKKLSMKARLIILWKLIIVWNMVINVVNLIANIKLILDCNINILRSSMKKLMSKMSLVNVIKLVQTFDFDSCPHWNKWLAAPLE